MVAGLCATFRFSSGVLPGRGEVDTQFGAAFSGCFGLSSRGGEFRSGAGKLVPVVVGLGSFGLDRSSRIGHGCFESADRRDGRAACSFGVPSNRAVSETEFGDAVAQPFDDSVMFGHLILVFRVAGLHLLPPPLEDLGGVLGVGVGAAVVERFREWSLSCATLLAASACALSTATWAQRRFESIAARSRRSSTAPVICSAIAPASQPLRRFPPQRDRADPGDDTYEETLTQRIPRTLQSWGFYISRNLEASCTADGVASEQINSMWVRGTRRGTGRHTVRTGLVPIRLRRGESYRGFPGSAECRARPA